MRAYDELDPDMNFQWDIPAAGADYWRTLRNDGRLPQRRDIDPVTIPLKILPHVLLVDVEGKSPSRFRWRLIGTHTTKTLGRDSTGQYIDAVVPAEIYDEFIEPVRWSISHRKPVRVWGKADHANKEWVGFENLIAPLVDDDGEVNMIFGITHYGNPDH